MSNDIERLLAAAADDADRPLTTDVDDLLVRARRSVRKSRIATVSTAVITTGVIIAGVATWSANRHESVGPAGESITYDANTGRITGDETGARVQPPPPVSTLSDANLRDQCKQADNEWLGVMKERGPNPYDKAGPLDARWKVVVKAGAGNRVQAIFLSPDKSIYARCALTGVRQAQSYGRFSTSPRPVGSLKQSTGDSRVPDGVRAVLVDVDGESVPRQALLGTEGFYSLGVSDAITSGRVRRVRGYDEQGHKVYEYTRPTLPTAATNRPAVPESVTVKTADPVVPTVVLTKDPLTGKALVAPPPVSPLTDEQITTRCREVDDIYFSGSRSGTGDPRIKAAGPVTKDWQVALKTGTGNKLTAVLISPDKRVFAWCHMLGATAKGSYDYTRGAVQADGKFADDFSFGMVPDGVAQLVVDLPKQGPTRALISNGFYIWGLTGGNSDIRNVRVRGYDADGKQVYDVKKNVDADFD
jgi:hypothetical protein